MSSQIPQDPADIERAIKQKQSHLADTVNELVFRSQPKQLVSSAKKLAREEAQSLFGVAKQRAGIAADNAKAQALGATGAAREAVAGNTGETRPETMVAAAAGATSALLFLTYFATRNK